MVTHSIGRHRSSPPVMPKVIAVIAPAAALATVRPINQRRKSVHERSCGRSSSKPVSHRSTSSASTAFAIAKPRAKAMSSPAYRLAAKTSTAAARRAVAHGCGARISMTVTRVVAGHHRATMAGSGAWFRQYTDSTSAALASTAMSRPFARERCTGRSLSWEPSVKRPHGSPGSLCCTTVGQKHRLTGSNTPSQSGCSCRLRRARSDLVAAGLFALPGRPVLLLGTGVLRGRCLRAGRDRVGRAGGVLRVRGLRPLALDVLTGRGVLTGCC